MVNKYSEWASKKCYELDISQEEMEPWHGHQLEFCPVYSELMQDRLEELLKTKLRLVIAILLNNEKSNFWATGLSVVADQCIRFLEARLPEACSGAPDGYEYCFEGSLKP